jgi:hypothetical protein
MMITPHREVQRAGKPVGMDRAARAVVERHPARIADDTRRSPRPHPGVVCREGQSHLRASSVVMGAVGLEQEDAPWMVPGV